MGTGIPQPVSCPGNGLESQGFESHQEEAIFFLLYKKGPSSPLFNGTVVLSLG